jgi:GNAT superfamily N-acetyltransferase
LRIAPYEASHLPAAAALFASRLRALRRRVPALPSTYSHPERAAQLLAGVLSPQQTLVALEGEELVGYLGWRVVAAFRDTPRRGAYSPEFGHAARRGREVEVHRELYRAAAARWLDAHCEVHVLTCLAGERRLERFWFESGFGMLLHDALRPLTPIEAPLPAGVKVRRATAEDAGDLARLDTEHRRHYAAPPVLMAPRRGDTAARLARFLADEPNGIWLAQVGGEGQAFMRFEPESHGAARISLAPDTISITGAYTRPAWRGRGLGAAILARAVGHYAAAGYARMAVDYETLNPQALAFWPRFFRPVAVSYMRAVERW